jgi:Flp pilus assembly pilin Flp
MQRGLSMWCENALSRLWGEEQGQTMTEYGLVVVLVAIALMAGLTLVAGNLDRFFTAVGHALPLV